MAHFDTAFLPTPVTDPYFPLSPYHLSIDQVRFYDENGYLVLPGLIPPDLLQRLQQAGDGWIRQGMQPGAGGTDAGKDDYVFREKDGRRMMFRVNYLHDKGFSASLELLGSPQVLATVESLCGVNFVPTYEAMVFKQEGDGAAIRWHQDAIHPRRRRIFNLDVYLDASRKGAGALFVIPGTQVAKQAFCNIENGYGWDYPGAMEVEMEPGDVLVHDVMIAHGSPETHGKALRRTIYYEFRAAEEILAEGPWDRQWIDRRLRLLPAALRQHAQAFPQAEQFQWKINDVFRPASMNEDDVELKIPHLVHTPGSYCSAGDAGKL
jgi:ectoine hydroxylase-related dioxygenase (phytanoyl-CoA dioxygenase family)